MALDFPSSPSDGDTFLGANGINYIYDGTDGKWKVYNDPFLEITSGPETLQQHLEPVYNGDSVETQNPSDGTRTINLRSNGKITVEAVDVDSFPSLP